MQDRDVVTPGSLEFGRLVVDMVLDMIRFPHGRVLQQNGVVVVDGWASVDDEGALTVSFVYDHPWVGRRCGLHWTWSRGGTSFEPGGTEDPHAWARDIAEDLEEPIDGEVADESGVMWRRYG